MLLTILKHPIFEKTRLNLHFKVTDILNFKTDFKIVITKRKEKKRVQHRQFWLISQMVHFHPFLAFSPLSTLN